MRVLFVPFGGCAVEPDGRLGRPFHMRVLTKMLRVSIGMAVCAGLVSACGTSGPQAADPAVATPTAERPPPLACKTRQMILDHFGQGRGADSPEQAAAPYQDPGTTLVVDRDDEGATIHVVSADGQETVAVMGASQLGGWRIDTVESCLGDKSNNVGKR